VVKITSPENMKPCKLGSKNAKMQRRESTLGILLYLGALFEIRQPERFYVLLLAAFIDILG